MIVLRNMGSSAFRDYIKDKEIVIFGAGRALDSCIDIYFEDANVVFVVDNSNRLWDTYHCFNGKQYRIVSIESLVELYKKRRGIICYINSPFYAYEIVEQLDSVPELEGLECYLSIVMRNTVEEIKPWEFTKGPQLIPKKIHYIWVGGNELPDDFKRNIESWKKYNPDYEIIRWDESTLVFDDCNYIQQAYGSREWAYVSNYIRLKIIYNYGGIYLDTDVEAVSGFDDVLNDEAFFNMGCADMLNNGCGFGAIMHHPLVCSMKDCYEKMTLGNGLVDKLRIQSHMILNGKIKEWGFKLTNQYQKEKGVVLYPSEVMSPNTIDGMNDARSKKTISIHKESGTWKKDSEHEQGNKIKILTERIKGII